MVRILEILDRVLEEIRKNNPYGLVLKGGTALAVHHLSNHRESEDLDFDLDKKYMDKTGEVTAFIRSILDRLQGEGYLKSYTVRKEGMASTNRYHMNLTVEMHRPFYTKIDLDFVDLPERLEYEGELGFYTIDRMFVDKLLTFESRKELKDFYDISHILRRVEPGSFDRQEKLASLIDRIIDASSDGALVESYRKALRNLDLKFRNIKESNVGPFIEKTQRNLRTFRNDLLKG